MTVAATDIFAKRTAQLVHRITLQMNKQGERVLQDKHDLTISQFFFLMQMVNGRQCQRDLADSLGVTPAAVSRQAAHLIDRGYVRRSGLDDDRRYGYLEVSPAGMAAFRSAEESLADYFDATYAGLSGEQKQKIDRALVDLAECFYQDSK